MSTRNSIRRWPFCAALILAFVSTSVAHALPKDHAEVVDSAAYLLRDSTRVYRNGRHIRLLLALRHLRDPMLEPLFAHAAADDEVSLKVHGILGLAESREKPRLDLERIATLGDARYQALIVSEAMDRKLLTNDQGRQLLEWKNLDAGVRLVVAMQLHQAGRFDDPDLLKEGIASENLAQRNMAHLLLAARGDKAGLAGLDALSASDAPERDDVRLMIITSAMRYEMPAIRDWAAAVAADERASRTLRFAALEAALRFQAQDAAPQWLKQIHTSEPYDQVRLARLALKSAATCDPQVFTAMISLEEPLIQEMGRAGLAIAEQRDIGKQVSMLVLRDPPNTIINGWAMQYASRRAEPDDRHQILKAVIDTYAAGPDRGRVQRLDDALSAATLLVDSDVKAARRLLEPILSADDTDASLVHAILMGLLSSKADHPETVIEGLPPFDDVRSRSFALLLRARHAESLSDEELADLGLIVRGGPISDPMLRVQAAWAYLRLTGQTDAALTRALAD